jgi:hypothetical protein
VVTFTHKVNWCLSVSLTVEERYAPLLNLDPLINCEVMQATDMRVFKSPLGHWIYNEGTSMKSYFERIGMLNH